MLAYRVDQQPIGAAVCIDDINAWQGVAPPDIERCLDRMPSCHIAIKHSLAFRINISKEAKLAAGEGLYP